jgi:small subunit ribosomal protein S20
MKKEDSMANIKSAIKRIKIASKRKLRNQIIRSRTKTAVKKTLLAVAESNKEDAKSHFIKAVSLIDKACSKGVYHKNNASRQKSRLAKKIAALA